MWKLDHFVRKNVQVNFINDHFVQKNVQLNFNNYFSDYFEDPRSM